jgi:hypothetical protein
VAAALVTAGDLARQQPVAVLGEGRRFPPRVVHADPDEPTKQQVELDPLHELSLRADRVEGLQQQSESYQRLRRHQFQQLVSAVDLSEHRGLASAQARAARRRASVSARRRGFRA